MSADQIWKKSPQPANYDRRATLNAKAKAGKSMGRLLDLCTDPFVWAGVGEGDDDREVSEAIEDDDDEEAVDDVIESDV